MSESTLDRKDEQIPSCTMFVDKEGRWFHHGAPIIHPDLIALFYQCLFVNEAGEYCIKLKDQVCRLDVEDTPYVIVRTDFISGSPPGVTDCFRLRLIDNSEEVLAPETLSIGAGHVMYCRIRGGKFKARFLRPSYYQLASYIEHDSEKGKYFLFLNGTRYYIRRADSSPSLTLNKNERF